MSTWNKILIDSDQFVWQGEWTTATGYVVNDCVENDGSGYVCISAHTSGDTDDEPDTGATWETYWDLLVAGYTDAEAKAAAVDDTAYNESTWDAVTDQAPSKNVVRDELEDHYAAADPHAGYILETAVLLTASGEHIFSA